MKHKEKGVPRALFNEVVSRGSVFHSPHLTLRVTESKTGDFIDRFSFVVSGKVAKHATDRNLIKRRGRAIVRDILKTQTDIWNGIFFTRKGVGALSYQELREEIVFLFRKATILP